MREFALINQLISSYADKVIRLHKKFAFSNAALEKNPSSLLHESKTKGIFVVRNTHSNAKNCDTAHGISLGVQICTRDTVLRLNTKSKILFFNS